MSFRIQSTTEYECILQPLSDTSDKAKSLICHNCCSPDCVTGNLQEIVVDKLESLKVQSPFFSFVLELRFHLYNLLRFFSP